jgi:hypothetical protein
MESKLASVLSCENRYSEISLKDSKEWWNQFVDVIRQCFTPSRADLEMPSGYTGQPLNDELQEWGYSASAEILSNSGTVIFSWTSNFTLLIHFITYYLNLHYLSGIQCREQIITFLCSPPHGMTILFKFMEV